MIDGYNVIGVLHGSLEQRRKEFIDTLIEYNQIRHHNITLVFDGWKSSFGQSSTIIGGIDVIYTGPGDKADDFIKRIITTGSKSWTVISSDREIIANAWRYDCVPITSSQFEHRLYLTLSNLSLSDFKGFDDETYNDYEGSDLRKGNPRMPSKKDRIIKKTLARL